MVMNQKGTILFFSLWTLVVLSLFAVSMGLSIHQKLKFVERIENRTILQTSAASGIRKAIGILNADYDFHGGSYSVPSKMIRHSNLSDFSNISSPRAKASIAVSENGSKQYGLIDEERKININVASKDILKRLIKLILEYDEVRATRLADSIIDWREIGESEIVGFFSDDFYDNLEYPYPAKNEPFEIPDELKLVKGVTEDVSARLLKYLTVYGSGKININTAQKTVFIALGLDHDVADKILRIRRGPDGIDYTGDDIVFPCAETIIELIQQEEPLNEREEIQIRSLMEKDLLSEKSEFYSIESNAKLYNSNESVKIRCIYDASQKKIVYWQED